MTRRQQRMLGVALLVLGVGIATAFTLTAFRKNLMNFYTPGDLETGAVVGERLRLGGLVQSGSLKRGDGLRVDFIMADCTQSVPVRYEGILPDLFREGQGVVATGSLDAAKVFIADEILAKHDENYIPPQIADSLKTANGHSCDSFKPVNKG